VKDLTRSAINEHAQTPGEAHGTPSDAIGAKGFCADSAAPHPSSTIHAIRPRLCGRRREAEQWLTCSKRR
jgi:hypothetical protein